MKQRLLHRQDIVDLYKKAKREQKVLLLKVSRQEIEGTLECVAYGTGLVEPEMLGQQVCLASSLAGSPNFSDFAFNIGSNYKWKVIQTDKQALLLYLDKPWNSEMIKKILDGTLQVLGGKV